MINWKSYNSYQVFDELLESLVLRKKSYITTHDQTLNIADGLAEIKKRFVDNYDESGDDFESKINKQFNNASQDSKIIFANIEYLWCMPVANISPEKKHDYVLRWFASDNVYTGENYFFSDPHIVANPGQWNNQNKFYEISCIIRIFTFLFKDSSINSLSKAKRRIGELSYNAIYSPESLKDSFNIKNKCATHHMLLHLSNPDKYEAIVSEAHKDKIVGVTLQMPSK